MPDCDKCKNLEMVNWNPKGKNLLNPEWPPENIAGHEEPFNAPTAKGLPSKLPNYMSLVSRPQVDVTIVYWI